MAISCRARVFFLISSSILRLQRLSRKPSGTGCSVFPNLSVDLLRPGNLVGCTTFRDSTQRVLAGFLLAALFGIPLGVLIGDTAAAAADLLLDPLIQAMRTVPRTSVGTIFACDLRHKPHRYHLVKSFSLRSFRSSLNTISGVQQVLRSSIGTQLGC